MNFIIICLDTLRWDALGCYGSERVQSPYIDRYAQNATRFEAAYCASFPIVPMRVDAYTGNVNWPRYGWKKYDPDQPVLPQILRDHGYHTALVLDTKNNVSAGLHEHYDDVYLIEKNRDDGVAAASISVPVPMEHYRQNARLYIHDRVQTSHYKREPDWFVARTMLKACEWLEENADREKWFLWVDTFEIHEDWRAPDYYTWLYAGDYSGPDYSYPNYGYTDIYSQETLQHLRDCYAAEVTLTDRWVGHFLRQIELMNLFESTCVILLSDHGMYLGEHDRMGKHTVHRDDPWPLYDEVAKIPLLVWVPASAVPPSIRALCQPADVFPTVLDYAGLPEHECVGQSWKPLLSGRQTINHDFIFSSCHSGGGPGKIDYLTSQIRAMDSQYVASFGPGKAELFRYRDDIYRSYAPMEPDPQRLRNLANNLAEFMRKQGADEQYIREYVLQGIKS